MMTTLFAATLIIVPVLAVIIEWRFGSGISERHLRDHDVYTVSHTLARVPVVIIVLMATIGLVLGWLSGANILMVREALIMSFFSAFLIVLFVMWAALKNYRVMTYDDYMLVRPFIGPTRKIHYADIDHMRWTNTRNLVSNRNIAVYVNGKVLAVLIGAVDLDQILLRINRDDVIERLS